MEKRLGIFESQANSNFPWRRSGSKDQNILCVCDAGVISSGRLVRMPRQRVITMTLFVAMIRIFIVESTLRCIQSGR